MSLLISDTNDPAALGCYVRLNSERHFFDAFDACILWELEQLWKDGVETFCSCCGHGKRGAAIGVMGAESIEKMRALGYIETAPLCDVCVKDDVTAWFTPKRKTICETRE